MQRLGLQQKLQQRLSPLQVQLIKMLEVPTMEMEQRVEQELEANPALEEGREVDESSPEEEKQENPEDDFSLDEYQYEDDIPAYKLYANNSSKDDKHVEIPFSAGRSFHEYLISQLNELSLDETQEKVAEYIIGNIDEDGYLNRDVPSMVDDLAFMQNIYITDDDLQLMLNDIKQFDPPGVGASTLKECLLLQLLQRQEEKGGYEKAILLLEKSYDDFVKKRYSAIQNRMNVDEEELKEILEKIIKLNPKPGNAFSNPMNKMVQQVVPDFLLEYHNGDFELSLNNRNVPELKVSRTYINMLKDMKGDKKSSRSQKDALMFVKQKLDSAKWFIEAIKQRHNTLMVTMNAILEMQTEFFKDGEETLLKPMLLKHVAEKTGFDISTISRVSNSKYIETHFGIYALKYFFSDSLQNSDGEDVSTKEIKAVLKGAITKESKRKPLTDQQLTDLLVEKGYNIARRTVAKYREELKYPVARLRKEI